MAESSKTDSQTPELNNSAAPASKQGSQTSKTEGATEAEAPSAEVGKSEGEVPSAETDKPEGEVPSAEKDKPEGEVPSAEKDKPEGEPEGEVPSAKADEPEESAKKEEESAKKEEESPSLENASISSSKSDIQKLKKISQDRMSTMSTPSIRSTASQQELNVNQLVAEFLPRSLDEISDEELLGIVLNLEKSINLLETENEVFECYIRRMDPTLMEDFNERLEQLISKKRPSATRRAPTARKSSTASVSSRASIRRDTGLSLLESGPRITLTSKSDIVDKETALVQKSLNQFHTQMERAHADLKATEEEAAILTQETLESINRFERMCTYAVDPVTGRIPAEKYVRYMQEWLKIAESTIEKLRLHTNTMHQNIRHLKRLIKECKDLGYSIQPIDFDQMKIENRLLKETLGMKNQHLLELKQLSGKCSLVLVQHKKKLMQQESQGNALKEQIETKKGKITKVEKEHEDTKAKLVYAEVKLDHLKEFTDTHECPSVMEYIKKIDQVNRLKHEVLKWERRHGLKKLADKTYDHSIETSSLQSEVSQESGASSTSRSESDITEEYSL